MSTLCQILVVDDEPLFLEHLKNGQYRQLHSLCGGWGRFTGDVPAVYSILEFPATTGGRQLFRVLFQYHFLEDRGLPFLDKRLMTEGGFMIAVCHIFVVPCYPEEYSVR